MSGPACGKAIRLHHKFPVDKRMDSEQNVVFHKEYLGNFITLLSRSLG